MSDAPDLELALALAANDLDATLDTAKPDLVLAFVGHEHRGRMHVLPEWLRDRWSSAVVLGCSGGGVLAKGREQERGPALALAAASLPGVELTPFHFDQPDLELDGDPARWRERLGLAAGPDPHLLLLPDPFTWSGPGLLDALDRAFPAGIKLGGLASGGSRVGEHRLFGARSVHLRGTVGLAMRGNLEIETIVAQGCRPIGQPMFVTRHQRNVIAELDGRSAIEALQELFESLDADDRTRARHSLFIGVVVGRGDSPVELHGRGYFLIRNLIGVDPQTGSLAVATPITRNAVVQFHLRDGPTAAAELRELLDEHVGAAPEPPRGALLFSCLGRGRALYGESDHDSAAVKARFGADLPLAGFFGNGEIGPIGGRTHLHGYTSAIGLFRAATMV